MDDAGRSRTLAWAAFLIALAVGAYMVIDSVGTDEPDGAEPATDVLVLR